MFAIQWGLIISGCISSIPALQAIIAPGKSLRTLQDVLPSPSAMKIITLMQFNLFFALGWVYALSIFCAFFCPLISIGYMFATGNMVRVIYIMVQISFDKRWETSNFSKKGIITICIIQTILGVAIAACTYASSIDPEYLEYEASLKATAGEKFEEDKPYVYLIYAIGGLFSLTQIPGFISPATVLTQYITDKTKMPSDPKDKYALEFSTGFQQFVLAMFQVFTLAILTLAPSTFVVALVWTIAGFTNIPIFIFNIVNAEDYGFDKMPMLIFMSIIPFVSGASFMTLF